MLPQCCSISLTRIQSRHADPVRRRFAGQDAPRWEGKERVFPQSYPIDITISTLRPRPDFSQNKFHLPANLGLEIALEVYLCKSNYLRNVLHTRARARSIQFWLNAKSPDA